MFVHFILCKQKGSLSLKPLMQAAQKRISQSLQLLQRADPDLYELALMGEEAWTPSKAFAILLEFGIDPPF